MAYMNKEAKIQEEQRMVNRWEWLTEGIEDYETKLNTSIVLENTYNEMLSQGQVNEGWIESLLNEDEDGLLNEAPQKSSAVGSNVIPKVLFPVIRRVMPSLIANQLVSVQPIQARTGVIYYIEYTYSDSKNAITAEDEYSANPFTASAGPGYSTFYSSERFGPFTVTAATGSDDTITSTSEITNFFGSGKAGTTWTVKRIEVYNATTHTAYDTILDETADSIDWGVTGSNVGYDSDDDNIVLRDVANGASGWEDGDDLVVYLLYDQEGSDQIPEMEFSIGSKTVETDERKLKVRWTKEAEQDMKAYHKIDVESELVKVASMQMNYEIDRELLKSISDRVPTALSFIHDWSADAASSGNNTSGNYLDRHRALAQKLYMVSAKIAQYNRQGPASWMVVSPQVGAVMNMLPNFEGEISGGTFNVFEAGQLGGGMKVYVDPNKSGSDAGEILLGYKSQNTTYGAGMVYSPYHNWMSNTVTSPDNFNSIRGFFSRYAITEVPRGRYHYGKVLVNNLLLS